MKNYFKVWVYPFMILGSLLILQNSCKKDDNNSNPNTVSDIDGNVYHTVTIGTQVWMAENLKTTKFRNGSLIGTTTTVTQNIGNESAPIYQWAYNGDESNVATYGRLYTWFAATDPRNICPVGWHLPNDAEWNTLINFLGHPNDVGGKLKESGTAHWQNPNTGATNSSGFTALPGGRRSYDRPFIYFGTNGYWYSSTLKNSIVSVQIMGYTDYAITQGSNFDGKDGMSVRCLKD